MKERIHQVLVSTRVGGAGLLAIGLAADVRRRGSVSQAWVPGAGPAAEALERAGVGWQPYRLDRLQRGGVSQVLALSAIGLRLIRGRNPIVHVHSPLVYGLLSPFLAAVGARAVVQFHIDPTVEEVRWALQRPPAAVGTCSRHIATLVRTINEQAGRHIPVYPMPNAIDLDQYARVDRTEAKRRCGARPDRPLLLMLANLAEHKGQITALQAVRHLKDRGIIVDCWLAGEERAGTREFTDRLLQMVREFGIGEQVTFLGFRRDGPALLQAADIFLLPSSHEGLPLSVLEAQASGTVVVASLLPGVREVVSDGETGFLIDPADHQGYAARIETLLRDPDLYRRVAASALEYVQREHSWAGYVDRAWDVYRAVAGRGTDKGRQVARRGAGAGTGDRARSRSAQG